MMSQWLINFFAGLGIIETAILIVGALFMYFEMKNAPVKSDEVKR